MSCVDVRIIRTFAVLGMHCASLAYAVIIETVPVGNPNNIADIVNVDGETFHFGKVGYNYRIGKTEVTNTQYAKFLNSVAASDPYSLYNPEMANDSRGGIVRSGSPGNYSYSVKPAAIGKGPGGADYTYGDKPVVYVSWYDALRLANWLHNGQGTGDTEVGAYTIGPVDAEGNPLDEHAIVRTPGARWFIPSDAEWYKAAYHQNDGATGNYWDYPTATDVATNSALPSLDSGNSANIFNLSTFRPATGDFEYPLTDAGAYSRSQSAYGTFDQGGNVMEWTESYWPIIPEFLVRNLRGGAWDEIRLSSSTSHYGVPGFGEWNTYGIRLASVVPEPHIRVLALIGCLLSLPCRRGRR